MYDRITYQIGRYRLVSEHIPGNYGAPGVRRAPKRKRTPEEIEEQNQSNRERKVWRLILANFQEGDYHLVLTYRKDERPVTFEEGRKNLKDFLAKMRKEYRKAGIPFKWLAATEQGEKGAFHHHLILENRSYVCTKMLLNNVTGKLECRECGTDMLVRLFWNYGRPQFSMIDDPEEDGAHRQLASYFTKKHTKECNASEEEDKEERRNRVYYSRSRNLIVPQPQKRRIHRMRIHPGEPKAPKGYEIVKGSIETGINPVTGYPWQRYVLMKINPTRD